MPVRFGCGRTVGSLGNDLGFDDRRVVHRDLILERRRHQDVDLQFEQLLVFDRLAAGEAFDRFVLPRVVDHLGDVETVSVVDATLPVGDGNHTRAELRQQIG